jgi:hypothetical protein
VDEDGTVGVGPLAVELDLLDEAFQKCPRLQHQMTQAWGHEFGQFFAKILSILNNESSKYIKTLN